MTKGRLKCERCDECLGLGCVGQLPGLGGVFNNQNFQLNCEGWKELYKKSASAGGSATSAGRAIAGGSASCIDSASASGNASCTGSAITGSPLSNKINEIQIEPHHLRCGPVTGAVENIGYENEEDFYYPYLKAAADAGIGLCVGDGCPDLKLQLGVAAMKRLATRAAFFLKPYPDERLYERVEWVKPYAEYIGIDIDSYNILTMRNLVSLERKTAARR